MRSVVFICFFLFVSTMAHGHIKWFSSFDTTEIPLAPTTVLGTPGFWAVFLVSVEFIYFMVYGDATLHALQRNTSAFRDRLLKRLPPDFVYRALILTLIIFMSCIWAIGDFILTPELKHESMFVATIQVSILAALMTKHTAKIAGAGIFVLWIYAINEYGWFHMADYIIFLSIALFLIIGSKNNKNHVSSSAFLVLYLSISWTLQWVSVEKWAYLHWSYPALLPRLFNRTSVSPIILVDLQQQRDLYQPHVDHARQSQQQTRQPESASPLISDPRRTRGARHLSVARSGGSLIR